MYHKIIEIVKDFFESSRAQRRRDWKDSLKEQYNSPALSAEDIDEIRREMGRVPEGKEKMAARR